MQFENNVNMQSDWDKYDAMLKGPSKRHIFYWLKWYFVVRPALERKINKAKAEVIDKALKGDILAAHIPGANPYSGLTKTTYKEINNAKNKKRNQSRSTNDGMVR